MYANGSRTLKQCKWNEVISWSLLSLSLPNLHATLLAVWCVSSQTGLNMYILLSLCICRRLVPGYPIMDNKVRGYSSPLYKMAYRHTSFYCALLYCTLQILYKSRFFTNGRFVATLHWASLLAPFFQQHLFTLWTDVFQCHILVILASLQTFSLYLLWWSVISDLWCCYCNRITTHWRLWWWLAILAIKYF